MYSEQVNEDALRIARGLDWMPLYTVSIQETLELQNIDQQLEALVEGGA